MSCGTVAGSSWPAIAVGSHAQFMAPKSIGGRSSSIAWDEAWTACDRGMGCGITYPGTPNTSYSLVSRRLS